VVVAGHVGEAGDPHGLPAERVLVLDGVADGDGRGVPHVRAGEVDDHPPGVSGVVELADHVVGRGEEQRPWTR